ncbi:MAG: response regulator [Bacteroidia bacterium]|nr:response regulator [Bacteroidia bacterium]MCF8425389.1 response regulator [Bacteroidia bacterium]MCF8446430.1 response regulator [Bacteroidia bacterium]
MQKDSNAYRILLIEDNPGDALLVQDYLEENILVPQISLVTCFEDAQKKLNENEFDLIFLDLTLPDKQGLDLINAILHLAPNIPIIVLTGYADQNFAIKSLSFGIADYLIKEELNATVLYKSILYNIERNKILVNLKESEQRYSNLFHLSPLPMWVFDHTSLRILDVNNAAIEHYGYSELEFKSLTIRDLRPNIEFIKLDEVLQKKREDNDFKSIGNWIHRKKDGSLIQVEISSKSILYKGCEARIVLANDISERLNHIQKLELQNRAFKEISWMQSHVVRAPLARIMGLVSLLIEEDTSETDKKEFLKHLNNSAKELDQVIFEVVQKTYEVNKDFE